MSSTSNIYLIVGEDDYLTDAAARKVLEQAVEPSLRATAVETIDGGAENMELQLASLKACVASVQTPPFLDPVKLTWWRNVTFLPGNGRLAENVKVALEKFAKNLAANPLPPNQHLVISASGLLMTSIFAKTFKICADVVTFATGKRAKDRRDAALLNLPGLAKDEGLAFAAGAGEAFIAKVGFDTRTIISELAKMRTYLGDETNTVTTADITAISSPGGEEPELWELTGAVGDRNLPLTMKLLNEFAGTKGFGILLSTVMEKFFRDLCVYRDAVDQGWITLHGWARDLAEETIALLDDAGIGPNAEARGFITRKNAQASKNYTPRELRVARHRMLTVREKLVSSTATDDSVIAELLRILPRPAARRA